MDGGLGYNLNGRPVRVVASRRDRLLADGWETCSNSSTTTLSGGASGRQGRWHEYPCPDCVDGLVPNQRQVEAAVQAIGHNQNGYLWLDDEQARAALVAAGKVE